jgi:hypothetical protein
LRHLAVTFGNVCQPVHFCGVVGFRQGVFRVGLVGSI